MRRTEILQEILKMRFEEAYGGWTSKRLSQSEAAVLLGVCSRTFRRYSNRYDESGLEGILDKRLTQASCRRAPVDVVIAVSERYRTRHKGWNVKHYYSWYKRDWWQEELYLGKEHTAIKRFGYQGSQTGSTPETPGTCSYPRDDGSSGRKSS